MSGRSTSIWTNTRKHFDNNLEDVRMVTVSLTTCLPFPGDERMNYFFDYNYVLRAFTVRRFSILFGHHRNSEGANWPVETKKSFTTKGGVELQGFERDSRFTRKEKWVLVNPRCTRAIGVLSTVNDSRGVGRNIWTLPGQEQLQSFYGRRPFSTFFSSTPSNFPLRLLLRQPCINIRRHTDSSRETH